MPTRGRVAHRTEWEAAKSAKSALLLILELCQAADVLADDVELKVDFRTDLYVVEVGMLKGVGDDTYFKRVALRIGK